MFRQKLINIYEETLEYLENEAKEAGLNTTAHIRSILIKHVREAKEKEHDKGREEITST